MHENSCSVHMHALIWLQILFAGYYNVSLHFVFTKLFHHITPFMIIMQVYAKCHIMIVFFNAQTTIFAGYSNVSVHFVFTKLFHHITPYMIITQVIVK